MFSNLRLLLLLLLLLSPEPKIITPQHDYSKRPLQLFWFDPIALQAIAETDHETTVLTQVLPEKEEVGKGGDAGGDSASEFPLKAPVASVADFKTTPAIHAGSPAVTGSSGRDQD